MDDVDDEFTGAGDHLAKVKAAISARLKNSSSDIDIFSVIGSGPKKRSKEKSAAEAKKPSPPKVQKVVHEDSSPEIIGSDPEEYPEEEHNEILLSSDEEPTKVAVECAKRRTAKENKNRVNHFRMREYDSSFNEDQKILSYLDGVNQKENESKQPSDPTEAEQNCEMNIKVRWNFGEVERYRLRKMQPFKVIFQALSEKYSTAMDKIMLEMGDDERVSPEDTPDSLGITVGHILSGYALKETVAKQTEDCNKDKFEIKIQFPDRRSDRMSFFLEPNENFTKLFIMLSEKLQLPVEKLRLQFEGELVKQKQTAEELDLESGDVMDCLIHS